MDAPLWTILHELRPDSDIDVPIILQPPVESDAEIRRTSLLTSELCLRYNVLISRLFMDESRYLRRQSPLLRNIEREGIAV